jgi:tetratricopeptide (TPR) repeat protein
LKEADEILHKTWVLRHHADLCVQADLAESIVRLQIRYKNYEDARHWLNIEEDLVHQAQLGDRPHIRYFIPVLYHRAEILYKEGNYPEAKALFEQAMQNAEQINWHRVINSAQNWLADIAIVEGDRDEAQQLLIKGLAVAESHKNKRRLARYQRSRAYWENRWGTTEETRKFATKAIDSFEHLGMTRDAEEMQFLLNP